MAQQQKDHLHNLYEVTPVLQEASALAQEFARIVTQRQGSELDAWLDKATQSTCHEMRLFARGLCQDLLSMVRAVKILRVGDTHR